MRGQYVDAARNYQLSEFNPRSNSAYETADGDRKPREVIFYAWDNEYEAQRNATVVLKRSRLRKSCTLQLGLSCYKLRPWDVVTVNLPTLGLCNQLMRCIEWQFSQHGYIEAQFLEEDNTTWNDPDVSDYTVSTDPTNPTSDNFIPYPPTSLTATGVTDGIVLSWEADTRQLPTMYRVYQDSVATGYTDSPTTATLVITTPNTSVTIRAGGFVAASRESLSFPDARMLIGDAMLAGAAVLWGATTVMIRACPLAQVAAGKTLLYQLAVSPVVLPLGSLFKGKGGVAEMTPLIIGSLAYQMISVAFITYLAWFWLLRRYPPSRLASFTFLTPLFGVMAGGFLLNEAMTSMLMLALALVGSGIYLVNRPAG